MKNHDVFWKLETLSDRQLLERLGSVLGSSRRLMAELVAHLGEVEERRLHLGAACSSMFVYCLKLGMTEDEAYRRIEAARLARRYPAVFPLLADGRLSISVLALLKPHLSRENHLDLLNSAAGRTVAQARELIAARFPRPDVPSSVRKLPGRPTMSQPSLAMSTATESSTCGTEASDAHHEATPSKVKTGPLSLPRAAPSASRIEPLSAERYKVQLTASAELARKLELARDLMRHSYPTGELGPIVERALDLLIESLMQRRFGKRKKASPKQTSERGRNADAGLGSAAISDRATIPRLAAPDTAAPDTAAPDTTVDTAAVDTVAVDTVAVDTVAVDAVAVDTVAVDTAAVDTAAVDTVAVDTVASRTSTLGGAVEPATSVRVTFEPAAPPSGAAPPVTAPPVATPPVATPPVTAPPVTAPPVTAPPVTAPPVTPTFITMTPAAPPSVTATPIQTPGSANGRVVDRVKPEHAPTAYIPRSTRRAVFERDGLGCSWVDEHGLRCGSRAWLEHDHRNPRAKGGGAGPDNVRLLCRQHNRFAAEREFGRRHVEHTIAERRSARARRASPAI